MLLSVAWAESTSLYSCASVTSRSRSLRADVQFRAEPLPLVPVEDAQGDADAHAHVVTRRRHSALGKSPDIHADGRVGRGIRLGELAGAPRLVDRLHGGPEVRPCLQGNGAELREGQHCFRKVKGSRHVERSRRASGRSGASGAGSSPCAGSRWQSARPIHTGRAAAAGGPGLRGRYPLS